jgi:hypothetical protein
MRRGREDGAAPNAKLFPRGGLTTATQQVMLLGMGAI